MPKGKPIAIGVEDYKRIIERQCYYIDKTLLIQELLDRKEIVTLFTRPRRFGKTLALSMLKTFFECDTDVYGNITDNCHYFDGTKIEAAGEKYMLHQGKYPVINLSLKSAKQPTFEMAYKSLIDEIAREYERHRYLLNSNAISESNSKKYQRIMEQTAEPIEYVKSLTFLSECLKNYHGKKTIILLDEYDVPLENSHFRGFYDQMIDFIRSLFEAALKTNENLELSVITGCLRISKESIFTGLNNLKVVSVLNIEYSEYFGFTDSEVQQMLKDYEMEQKMSEVRKWYDGYLFGNVEVYNPWSVINYVDAARLNIHALPKPYWSNTSSNSIVRKLIETADAAAKKEIENLIAGGFIEIQVHEDITYTDVYKTQDNLWNFLFFTGYLKKTRERLEERRIYLTLTIPNEEVRSIYENTIRDWFGQKLKLTDFTAFYQALLKGDIEVVESVIKRQLQGSISYYDNAESFYHGFLLGLLGALEDYEIVSNRESGDGRPDILLIPLDEKQPAVIIELKRALKFTQMELQCDTALSQIKDRKYDLGLLDEGYLNIRKYGICFCKKSCMVKTQP